VQLKKTAVAAARKREAIYFCAIIRAALKDPQRMSPEKALFKAF